MQKNNGEKNSYPFEQNNEHSSKSDPSKEMLKSHMKNSMDSFSTALETHGLNTGTLSSFTALFFQSLLELPEGTACKKSCSYCCHLRVGVSIAETIVIFEQINANATDTGFQYLKQRVLDTAQSGDTLKETWWLESKTPCPFLDTEGQKICTIYDIRPFSCRAYHSTEVDACRKAFEKAQKTQIPCFPLYRAFTDTYSSVFIHTMSNKGLFSYQVGFVAALSILFKSNDTGRLIEQWFEGKDIFKPARLS